MTNLQDLPTQLNAISELLHETKFVDAKSQINIFIDRGGVKITHTNLP